MTETQHIPWKRIAVEAAAIVGSILLAFAIDAWWDDYQNRSEEQRILVGLKSEFEQNLGLIEIELSYRHAVIDSILKILDAAVATDPMEPEALDSLIGDLTWWQNIKYYRGAIDGLLQSGGISFIGNDELRLALASMPGKYDDTTGSELYDQHTSLNVIIPYLRSHASLVQISNTQETGRPGVETSAVQPIFPVGDPEDHLKLLSDQEFLGIVVQEHWNHGSAIRAYESLKSALENNIRLIESEMNH